MSKKVTCSEEQQRALLVCVTELERDDQFIREKNIKFWKKAEEYWRLNQFIYWDEVALDYRTLSNSTVRNERDDDNDELEPKTFPIYRAYGESTIAAMAAVIPSVHFPPDDSSNAEDINTSNAYTNISELIQKHNKAPLLFIKSLTTLYNQGLIASHVYWDEDDKYGTKQVPKYKNEKVKMQELNCPECGEKLGVAPIEDEGDEDNNNEEDKKEPNEAPLENPKTKTYTCDQCGYQGNPEEGKEFEEEFPRLDGYTDAPKGRVCIDVYGPLNVRINSYAKKQSDVGLLELQIEMNSAAARDEFEDIADKINTNSDYYSYERWGRTSSELLSDTMFNQVTVRYCWLRPWGFQAYGKGEAKQTIIQQLKKKFPHGCCVVFVNDIFAEAYDEAMDDHWVLSENPLDGWLHAVPMGKASLDTQDAFNETENLNLQKQAYGIKETFVSTDLIEENAYRANSNGPGYVTFVKGRAGEALSNGIAQVQTADLNEEEIDYGQHWNTLAQFLLGAVPSIFGGNQQTGSKTAREYELSRSYALQRLSNPWTMMKFFWAGTMGNACRLFAQKLDEDEKFTRKNGSASETVWIKKAQLTGKIGNVEPDVSEEFPVTFAQRRDLLIQLITMQNPVVGEILLHPNNAENVKDALGFSTFYVPGEKDRTKQLYEINQLLNVDEKSFPPDSKEPTLQPDKDADDDNVHIAVCKLWMVSEEGIFTKETNPAAYLNVVLHKRLHEANLNPKIAGTADGSKPGQAPAKV